MKSKQFLASASGTWASFVLGALYLVLFICANTNSCTLVYQPETPTDIRRFSRVE